MEVILIIWVIGKNRNTIGTEINTNTRIKSYLVRCIMKTVLNAGLPVLRSCLPVIQNGGWKMIDGNTTSIGYPGCWFNIPTAEKVF